MITLIEKINSLEQQYHGENIIPTDYISIQKYLDEIKKFKDEIEKQICRSEKYLKIRKFFKEKILGQRVLSIEELFNLQILTLQNINFGLKIINQEARQKLEQLEIYIEKVNYEYSTNLQKLDYNKDSLIPLIEDQIKTSKQLSLLKKKNEEFYQTEKRLRKNKRTLYESCLDYKKSLDLIEDLGKEKKAIESLENFFRFSIHLSERLVAKAQRFENHIINTKDSYLLAKEINQGFDAVAKAVQGSSTTISQLQNVLAHGLKEMGDNIIDSSLTPYQEFETLLNNYYKTVNLSVNQKDLEKEKLIFLEREGTFKEV